MKCISIVNSVRRTRVEFVNYEYDSEEEMMEHSGKLAVQGYTVNKVSGLKVSYVKDLEELD